MRSTALTALLFGAVLACREPNTPEPIDSTRAGSVDIQPALPTLRTGQQQQFVAIVRDLAGRAIPDAVVSWRSTDSTVISIDATGLATAGEPTTSVSTRVTATFEVLADTAVVTVNPWEDVFNVWPDTNALVVGTSRTVTSRLIAPPDPSASDRLAFRITPIVASWTSSDTTVVTVNGQGTVTALSEGRTTIRAVAPDGRIAVADLAVLPATPFRFATIHGGAGFIDYGTSSFVGTSACALNAGDGGIYCWGYFGALRGETVLPAPYGGKVRVPDDYVSAFDRCERYVRFGMGNSSWLDRTRCSEIPVRMFASSSFSALAGWDCALSAAGEAFCWGSNESGQLGIGTTDALKHGPTAVATTERFQSITAFSTTRCGLRADGIAYCWGGAYGATPTRMPGDVVWRSLSREGACGIAADSTAYCWSGNTAPVVVGSGLKFVDIVTAENAPRLCALTAAGELYCWQSPGLPPATVEPPVLATGGVPLVSVVVDIPPPSPLGTRVCGLSATGEVYCVATSGSGTSMSFSLVRRELGEVRFKSIRGTCGIALDEKVYCWAVGDTTVRLVPRQ